MFQIANELIKSNRKASSDKIIFTREASVTEKPITISISPLLRLDYSEVLQDARSCNEKMKVCVSDDDTN